NSNFINNLVCRSWVNYFANSTLEGGAGNDRLDGGYGNDTYVFGKGSGQDTVLAYDPVSTRVDVVKLTGLNSSDVVITREPPRV
ncbi:hypothetical protein, partial [Pseudomonas amygdali]|uniref:hypothetical protein n=1 Tax=Pseudomonas amygdali TaxID=47877 RepID=UPI0006E6809A